MKTVFTVGVFDLLHVGHILLFKHAKELGDRLVVAVQKDDVILKYKPEAEMVNTTEERLFMVKSIRYVDQVVTDDDVDEIVKKILRNAQDDTGEDSSPSAQNDMGTVTKGLAGCA